MLRAKITKGGKIAIPALYRKQLSIKTGDDIIFELQDNKIIMTSLKAILEQSRQLVQIYLNQQPKLEREDVNTAVHTLTGNNHD